MKLFKIVETSDCFFAVAPKLNSGRLRPECSFLKAANVHAVYSLMGLDEESKHGLSMEPGCLQAEDIIFKRYSMTDRAPPDDLDGFKAVVRDVLACLRNKEAVVVHCVGGIGRSGLVALAVLHNRGMAVDDALTFVSNARGRMAPDTPAQIEWFKSNATRLRLDA